MKVQNTLTVITLSSLALFGCGGSGSSSNNDNNAPSEYEITGKVIDGYITGAQVFLDLNNNMLQDSGEPAVITGEDGSFVLPIESNYKKCISYVPVVTHVPVGAIDSDYGEVTEAYTLISPPTHIRNEPTYITPLTTMVWNEAISNLEMTHTQAYFEGGCEEIAQNEELYNKFSTALDESAKEMATAYNMTHEEIYGDFIADENTEAHALAVNMVEGYQRAFSERTQMIADGKDVWRHSYTYIGTQDWDWKLTTGYTDDITLENHHSFAETTLIKGTIDEPDKEFYLFATDVVSEIININNYKYVTVSEGFIIDSNMCKGSESLDAHKDNDVIIFYRRMSESVEVTSIQECYNNYGSMLIHDSVETVSPESYFYMQTEGMEQGSELMAYNMTDVIQIDAIIATWDTGYSESDDAVNSFSSWWRKGKSTAMTDGNVKEETRDIDEYAEYTIWNIDGTYTRECTISEVSVDCKE